MLLPSKTSNEKIQFICNTKVLYIELEDNTAIGVRVQCLIKDAEYSIPLISKTGDEIILSAGVFESPRILYDTMRIHMNKCVNDNNQLINDNNNNNNLNNNWNTINNKCSDNTNNNATSTTTTTNVNNNASNNNNNNIGKIIYEKRKKRSLQDHVLVPLMFLGNWCGEDLFQDRTHIFGKYVIVIITFIISSIFTKHVGSSTSINKSSSILLLCLLNIILFLYLFIYLFIYLFTICHLLSL